MNLDAHAASGSTLERVVVTTGDGRVYDLGKPKPAWLFKLRVAVYKFQRRKEF